jgi:hypothetical protein
MLASAASVKASHAFVELEFIMTSTVPFLSFVLTIGTRFPIALNTGCVEASIAISNGKHGKAGCASGQWVRGLAVGRT